MGIFFADVFFCNKSYVIFCSDFKTLQVGRHRNSLGLGVFLSIHVLWVQSYLLRRCFGISRGRHVGEHFSGFPKGNLEIEVMIERKRAIHSWQGASARIALPRKRLQKQQVVQQGATLLVNEI